MRSFFQKSLRRQVVLIVTILVLAQTACVGYFVYRDARSAVEKPVLEQLAGANKQRVGQVLDFLQGVTTDLSLLARNSFVRAAVELLSFYSPNEENEGKGKAIKLDSADYELLVAEIKPLFDLWLELFKDKKGYQDFLIVIGKGKGFVVYTQQKLNDRGETLAADDSKPGALAQLWRKVSQDEKAAIVDFSFYEPAGKPAMFVGYPVLVQDKFAGMLAVRIGTEFLDTVMKEAGAAGKSGDAFIVGEDFLMRTNSRLSPGKVLKQEVRTEAVEQALDGKSATGIVTDYRGVPVLASWTPLAIKGDEQLAVDFKWAMVGKIDSDEAFEAAAALGYRVIVIVVLIGFIFGVVAVWQVRRIAGPIATLAERADLISGGDMSVEIPLVERVNEIGTLARSFSTMLQNLRNQARNIAETVGVLTTSASEIAATAAQLSTSTSETSTAVSETATTVNQVRQAAKLAGEKARTVSERSQKAVAASESGKGATQDTIDQMGTIKHEMDSIADTVTRLSEHSRTIGAIVSSVRDIADQSNLLAVNASIEAARAGDYGKGFAVVAQEIKSLADQSNEATEEIRRILAQVSEAINAVVTATDRGRGAVDTGVAQSGHVGESIETLAHSVNESAQAASVIDATGEQQVQGLDQLAEAMAQIDQAMREGRDASGKLELSVDQLTDLAQRLKQLVAHYRM